jgi:hypothetical protein
LVVVAVAVALMLVDVAVAFVLLLVGDVKMKNSGLSKEGARCK